MIDLKKAATVFIGRRGENHFRNLEFDVSSLLGDEYPGETLTAIYKRPDGVSYPVTTSYADGILTWSPSATDTLLVGVGQLEIRVTYGEVIGKSARVLTIVEEALADGIAEPPEPPAQEWLNLVLAALAALNVNDTYALLNLTYNLLNDNYTLIGTTHDQMVIMRDTLYTRTGIILNHLHPVETASAPDMASRRASITFTGIAAGNNMVLGSVTYAFVTVLGSPAANTVQVLIQSNLSDTVKKLAEAIRGVQDAVNIAYGSGTNPHSTCTGYWTKQRFSIGDISVAPGESLFLLEKAEDVNNALTLTSTAASAINAFIRMPHLRYVLTGNSTGSGGVNSVRGPLHTILPIGSIVVGGQGEPLIPVPYDCHLVTICRQSDTTEKELDFYISNDEQTFTRISRSTPLGADSSTEAQHVQIAMRQSRVPAGYGLYARIGSNGTSATAYCDLKFTYHLYPAALAANN
ncbi:hypothetical protein [Faecalispora jeddahensis]|uniref:hypothetical protein n=1 Tax=Faecalispora jeddahensis TaxID=1414721 RepID=UPI00145C03CA|nr:hypothetical protein [Faecalispora jeddahensis]